MNWGDERLPERFWSRVAPEPNGGCWIWTGSTTPQGYGRSWRLGRLRGAHVIAYTVLVGEYPDGLDLDHLCRNRACCNPVHLEPVTRKENVRRGDSAKARRARMRSHCRAGHPYAGENLYVCPKGGRQCRACNRIHRRWNDLMKFVRDDEQQTATQSDAVQAGLAAAKGR